MDYYNYFDTCEDLNQIDDNLWLGNCIAAMNIQELQKRGITKILTVMDGEVVEDSNKEDGYIHKVIKIRDTESENIIKYFGECLNFINGFENVLVHCAAGASRSATIVIAYIMWVKRWDAERAHQFVQSKRLVAWPNSGFKQQLKMFEKLLVQNHYDISKINFKAIKWTPSPESIDYLSFI